MNLLMRSRGERGAVLVHAGVMLLALTAFSALTFDLGVMFVSRRQAQNAADAGALAAATSLAFVSNSQTLARNSALAAARQNLVWGQAPDVRGSDVTFPACPPGASGVAGTCVRADVFRTTYGRAGGNPLPTFFANIVGIDEQGTRASATAQLMASSGTADCVKPWAIPDKWDENQTPGWDPTDTFARYVQAGPGAGNLLPNPRDAYQAPTAGGTGTGYSLTTDFGRQLQLTLSGAGDIARPDRYYAVRVGGLPYQNAIEGCSTVTISPGATLIREAVSSGQTAASVNILISRDATATWNPAANGGRGAPTGGCMVAGTCTRSPRLVAMPLFSPDAYDAGPRTNMVLQVTNVIGFWIQRLQGNDVVGYITQYPTVSLRGPRFTQASLFARTVVLVR
jgi:hypothetical protein